jgi:hypothetical protein
MEHEIEISPAPTEAEREAILAALAADEAERGSPSPWAEALLPARDGEQDEP